MNGHKSESVDDPLENTMTRSEEYKSLLDGGRPGSCVFGNTPDRLLLKE
jgi:hypothetical protein